MQLQNRDSVLDCFPHKTRFFKSVLSSLNPFPEIFDYDRKYILNVMFKSDVKKTMAHRHQLFFKKLFKIRNTDAIDNLFMRLYYVPVRPVYIQK